METARRAYGAPKLLELPIELQLLCLGFASDPASLCSALSSCSSLHGLRERAFEVFSHRNWPQNASTALDAIEGGVVPDGFWQNIVHTTMMVHQANAATTDPARTFNQHVTQDRRIVVTEWLLQVSQTWQLDGTKVFMAARIMDAYLASNPLPTVKLLQLVGICSLRAVMQMREPGQCRPSQSADQMSTTAPKPRQPSPDGRQGRLSSHPLEISSDPDVGLCTFSSSDPNSESRLNSDVGLETSDDVDETERYARRRRGGGDATADDGPVDPFSTAEFVDICANAYSADDVERMTSVLTGFVASQTQLSNSRPLTTAPTARHFLRGLWAAAARPPTPPAPAAAVVPASSNGAVLHLSGFLLHLSLLEPVCCTAPPSHVACAAMSLALEALGLPSWPPALRRVLPLRLAEDLQPLRDRIAAAQMQYDVSYLRGAWMEQLSGAAWCLEPVPGEKRWVRVDEGRVACAGGAAANATAADTGSRSAVAGIRPVAEMGHADGGGATGHDAGAAGALLWEAFAGGDGGGAGAAFALKGAGGSASGGEGGGNEAVAVMRRRVEDVVVRKGPLPLHVR